MKNAAALVASLAILFLMVTTQMADAVAHCKYVGVPKGCVARPGVALRAAPGVGAPGVGVGAPGVGVGVGGPANRGGPVNRVGRR